MRVIIILWLLAISHLSQAQEVVFQRADLQAQLERKMPIIKQQPLYNLQISNPLLRLFQDEQRIGLKVNLNLESSLGIAAMGWAEVKGKIRYERSDSSFYVEQAEQVDLHIDDFPEPFKPQLQRLVAEFLAAFLRGAPLYQLQDKNLYESMAKLMLKDIRIDKDAVIAELDLSQPN